MSSDIDDTGVATASDTEASTEETPLRPFFFNVEELEGRTIADMVEGTERAEWMYDLFGRDLLTRTIVQTPLLSVFHESAKPGERVKPHRHGTHQVNYILRGELIYGNQRVTAGMGSFTPDTLYSWRAGDEGAEWIEIHGHAGGQPGIFTDRPGA